MRSRSHVARPKLGADLVDLLKELGIVFRAESGIACRVTADVPHAFCDSGLADVINRSVSLLLQQVSKRACATLVTLLIAAEPDGSIVIRVDVDEPDRASVEDAPPSVRSRLARLRGRFRVLGVHLETHRDSASARLVVPHALVSAG